MRRRAGRDRRAFPFVRHLSALRNTLTSLYAHSRVLSPSGAHMRLLTPGLYLESAFKIDEGILHIVPIAQRRQLCVLIVRSLESGTFSSDIYQLHLISESLTTRTMMVLLVGVLDIGVVQ